MKYLKRLNEYASEIEAKDPEVASLATELGDDTETKLEFDPQDPVGTSDGQAIEGATWEAEMSGAGDYKLSFKNIEGKDTTCVFKDTGNRRGSGGTLSAAFVGMPGTSSDGKTYVAEATMIKNSEDNYEIESFIIYEH